MSDELNIDGWLKSIEMSFAYERAAGVIESECTCVEPADTLENGWYDLDSATEDLQDEVDYLSARRLLQRHPEHASWVILCDEGDPIEDEAVTQ